MTKTSKRIIYISTFVLVTLIEVYIAICVEDNFVRPYIGDVLVVFVVYFFIRVFIPEGIKLLPLYVFLFAVCVEIAQYFQVIRLLGVPDRSVIGIIIGGTFDWTDILCYGIGCGFIGSASLLYRVFSSNKQCGRSAMR